ncbi:hypothetical protein DM01DRAFT_1331636 [Hesseltinella vesiculosa]|uniref:F-box domain-containing protein n=1 Tax=Hesseltinella vesiculosa TaxID=101127 RepID=A0A1X2GVZ9_9FUNG|nr:hypothetical protein DM01DRAFT_1331636 [Hesseltinella vesiculosa]
MAFLDNLPIELLCSIVCYLDTPRQYTTFCSIKSSLYKLGHTYTLRFAFLSHILQVDGTHHDQYYHQCQHIDTMHSLYKSLVCRFFASSDVPLLSPYAIDLIEWVPTAHFVHFAYPDMASKKYILQLFRVTRHRQSHISLTIPTLVNHATMAFAQACNRHRLINGAPRRVYYHVTLPAAFSQHAAPPIGKQHQVITLPDRSVGSQAVALSPATSHPVLDHCEVFSSCQSGDEDSCCLPKPSLEDTFFCMLHDLDSVVAFDEDLVCHQGALWFEDEGIVTDGSWKQVLSVGKTVIPDKHPSVRPSPVGYYDYYKKTTFQRAWRPCLLAKLYDCELRHDVRKGGLKRGDRFDCVFVYEHREDDTVCLEFCQRDQAHKRWMPQGFLLFAEHHITWHS